MNRLYQNEILGTVAIQSALQNSGGNRLSITKAMLVLPLLFDKSIRSVLKRKTSVVLGSKDLLISNPASFVAVRSRYDDLTITSLNAILLAKEMGMVSLEDNHLVLIEIIFLIDNEGIGKIAHDILIAGPKLGMILSEEAADLYQTFRIEL